MAAGDRLEADVKPKAGRVTSVAALPGQPAVALGMLHVSVPVGHRRCASNQGERRCGGAADGCRESPRLASTVASPSDA